MAPDPGKYDRKGTLIAAALTVGLHLAALLFCNFSGFKYIYPPPEEKSILIDFTDDKPLVTKTPSKPSPAHAPEPVDGAQAETSHAKPNDVPDTQPVPDGDVETPSKVDPQPAKEEPKEEEIIDTRALFRGGKSVSQSADTSSVRAGRPDAGTSGDSRYPGKGDWSLDGRRLDGKLPSPAYTSQETGTVVVRIWVNMYGSVEKAEVIGEKTTVTNKQLWQASREAALSTRFKQDINHPELQEGSITYVFSLK
ncbi:MAG: hypothetical protein MJY62_03590 [Bacteroidales bacterium]|nr:hypothetical protein [Bacteroidales bacterium]